MKTLLISTFLFLLAMIVSRLAIPIIIRISRTKNLLDVPNARSAAVESIPTLGGIGIFIGFSASLMLAQLWFRLPEISYFFLSTLFILYVGLRDDLYNMSARRKLLCQIIGASFFVMFSGIHFTNLQGVFGIYEIPNIVGQIFSIVVLVAFMNAFNLIDGIDGLASGITIFICLVLGIWFLRTDHLAYSSICFALIGALSSFFYCNVFGKCTKLFMGDSGSLTLGLITGILMIQFCELNLQTTGVQHVNCAPALAFGLFIYPLFDTIRVMTIRLLHKRSPFSPDKNHIHHRMLALGLSHRRSTLILIGANMLFIVPLILFKDMSFTAAMIYNLGAAMLFASIPAYALSKRKIVPENDPTQNIYIPKLMKAELSEMRPFQINPKYKKGPKKVYTFAEIDLN